MCRVLGMVALFNAEIVGAVIEIKSRRLMSIRLKLILENHEKATLLLTRLGNLVEIHRARMVNMEPRPVYSKGWG